MTTSVRAQRLRAITIAAGVLAALAGQPAGATSGDDHRQYPSALLCETGNGCRHSPISGMEQRSFWDALLGTEAPGSTTVICSTETGCTWAELSDADADLLFGGDGTPEGQRGMVFGEDEGMVIERPGTLAPIVFTDDEVAAVITVTPMSGRWTSNHANGVMDCGIMRLDIPAGDVEVGEMAVLDDGARLVATGMSADTETLELHHISGGSYHDDITVTADGAEMVLNFDLVFVDPGMGQGLIWAEISEQGIDCRIERPFMLLHESVDFFRDA